MSHINNSHKSYQFKIVIDVFNEHGQITGKHEYFLYFTTYADAYMQFVDFVLKYETAKTYAFIFLVNHRGILHQYDTRKKNPRQSNQIS